MPRLRIPDRRERLLVSARELALERGWQSTPVSEIAAHAGIGKGAVYLEFSDKSAILDSLVHRGMRGLSAAVHRRVLDADEVVDLSMIYRFAVESLLQDPLMRAFYLGDADVLGEHIRGVADERYRQRFDWLAEYIATLQSAGVIDPAVDLSTVVRMLSVFTIGLVHTPGTLGTTTDHQLRETVGLFSTLIGRGLATDLPVDADSARRAQLTLLERLDAQLDELDEQPPEAP